MKRFNNKRKGGIMRMRQAKFHYALPTGSWGVFFVVGIMLCGLPAGAVEPMVPWECSGFVEEVQNRCIRTFADLQQEKIAKLEKALEVQEHTVQQLQQQVLQQASATAELERQLINNPSRWYDSSSVQVYPRFGLSLRFGRDRFYGGSLFYGTHRYFGPRFYSPGHRRGHRH
jgi:hypothetical protein